MGLDIEAFIGYGLILKMELINQMRDLHALKDYTHYDCDEDGNYTSILRLMDMNSPGMQFFGLVYQPKEEVRTGRKYNIMYALPDTKFLNNLYSNLQEKDRTFLEHIATVTQTPLEWHIIVNGNF